MRTTRNSNAAVATTNAATTATDANTPDPEPAGEDVPDSQTFGQDVTPNIKAPLSGIFFGQLSAGICQGRKETITGLCRQRCPSQLFHRLNRKWFQS